MKQRLKTELSSIFEIVFIGNIGCVCVTPLVFSSQADQIYYSSGK